MTRIRLLQTDEVPPKIKELFQRIESNGARVLNLYRAVSHSHSSIVSFLKLGNSLLNKADLSPRLRELAILRIANISGSEYEWAQHVGIAREVGVSSQQIDDIHRWKESTNFSDEERAVLQYTDEVTLNIKVTDETYQSLREFLSESETVDLTLSIGYWGMVARILVSLEVEIDTQTATSIQELSGKS